MIKLAILFAVLACVFGFFPRAVGRFAGWVIDRRKRHTNKTPQGP